MARRVTLSPAALSYSQYGDNSRFMNSYLERQLGEMGRRRRDDEDDYIYDSIRQGIEYVNDNLRKYKVQDELEKQGMRGRADRFETAMTFEHLRTANTEMQRWITAHPEVRRMLIDQNLDGYSNTYKLRTKDVGDDDYDYRRATDGMMMYDKEGNMYVKHYFDDVDEGDRHRTFREKVQIQSTWDTIANQFKHSDLDFTHQGKSLVKMNK